MPVTLCCNVFLALSLIVMVYTLRKKLYHAGMAPIYFPNADLSYLQVYDLKTIQEIFSSIAHESEIEFNFPQGGCQQRAQMMSMMLTKKFNIDHCKVWLFPPVSLYIGDTRSLYIADKNQLTPNNSIEWSYHVAPVVQVKIDDEVRTLVIDPSIDFNEPILLEQWFDSIGNSSISKYTFLLPDKYFFYCCYTSNNALTTIFDGTFFNYENPVKDDLTMEKGLAINDMAIKIYHKYIQPLIHADTDVNKLKLEDLKAIFGNTAALDLLFSQNISGFTTNTSHRYIVTNYSDIINEARSIYNQRLSYWTMVTNELL